MDHLLLPEGAKHYIVVPYKCIEAYDDGDFHSYPERKGWSPNDVDGKDGYGGRSPEEIESFFQTWLFFGCLVEVFKISGIVANTEDFIDRDRGVITTKKLMGLIQEWRETWPEEVTFHLRSTPKALASSSILNTIRRVMSPHCYKDTHKQRPLRYLDSLPVIPPSPLSHELIASILVLECTLRAAAGKCYMDEAPLGRMGGTVFLRSLLKEKWCPRHVTWMLCDMEIDGHYYLGALPGLPEEELLRHKECAHSRCREKGVDEGTYVLKHAIEGCKCEEVVVPEDILGIISRGGTPIISVMMGKDEVPTLSVSEHNAHEGITPPYIALSHVWSDGMGNPKRNALPGCLVWQIQQRVDQVDFRERDPNLATVSFWMDTLCIPVDPKYNELRKLSIIKMRHIYQEASAVLILESQLQTILSTSRLIDRCVYIYLTKWRRRLWTYQEGGLARWLFVQFRDKPLVLHKTYRDDPADEQSSQDMAAQLEQHLAGSFISDIQGQFGLLQGALLNWTQEGTISQKRWMAFLPLVSSFYTRATTRISDETLCIATVLALDGTPLVQVKLPGPEKDDQELADRRMELLLRSIGRFQESFIFNAYPRLPTEGYRWAPRSFLGELIPLYDSEFMPSYKEFNKDHAIISTWGDGRSDVGLTVALPGVQFMSPSPGFVVTTRDDAFIVEINAEESARKKKKKKKKTIYLVELASDENGQYLSWTPEVSYLLVMSCPKKMRVKPIQAILGRLFSGDTGVRRVRHECLARVELLTNERRAEYDHLPVVCGGVEVPENQWIVV